MYAYTCSMSASGVLCQCVENTTSASSIGWYHMCASGVFVQVAKETPQAQVVASDKHQPGAKVIACTMQSMRLSFQQFHSRRIALYSRIHTSVQLMSANLCQLFSINNHIPLYIYKPDIYISLWVTGTTTKLSSKGLTSLCYVCMPDMIWLHFLQCHNMYNMWVCL